MYTNLPSIITCMPHFWKPIGPTFHSIALHSSPLVPQALPLTTLALTSNPKPSLHVSSPHPMTHQPSPLSIIPYLLPLSTHSLAPQSSSHCPSALLPCPSSLILVPQGSHHCPSAVSYHSLLLSHHPLHLKPHTLPDQLSTSLPSVLIPCSQPTPHCPQSFPLPFSLHHLVPSPHYPSILMEPYPQHSPPTLTQSPLLTFLDICQLS